MRADEAAVLVRALSRKQFAVAVSSFVENPESLTPLDRLRLGVWEFLMAIGFVTDTEARNIMQYIRSFADGLDSVPLSGRSHLLTIADKRWVTWLGKDSWYDMVHDKIVPELPRPAVLFVTCDVTALCTRLEREVRQREAKCEPSGGHTAGEAEPEGAT